MSDAVTILDHLKTIRAAHVSRLQIQTDSVARGGHTIFVVQIANQIAGLDAASALICRNVEPTTRSELIAAWNLLEAAWSAARLSDEYLAKGFEDARNVIGRHLDAIIASNA